MERSQSVLKIGIIFLVPTLLRFVPPPEGLSMVAWNLFAIYLGAILGLILRPFSEPIILLSALGISAVTLKNISGLLGGYASGTTWLVLAAILISVAFIETGLGKRLAFLLIRKIGKTPLEIGYAATVLDFILAAGIPSNTARDGGIIYPIMKSISSSLGSEPGETAKKIGAYLTYLTYVLSSTSSYVLITGIAPNMLIVNFAASIMDVHIDWMIWFKAAIPGIIMLFLSPWIVSKLLPPEIKKIDNKKISSEGLAELGPMKKTEKILVIFFLIAVIGWLTGSYTKIDATAVAIFTIAGCLVFRVISWDSVAGAKGAWSTFVWYGGIIGLASLLGKEGFFKWLGTAVSAQFDLTLIDPVLGLVIILLMSCLVRYIFASGSAYVASMVPVFFTLGIAANLPLMPLALSIGFSLSYASMLTHYGHAGAPIMFGAGYIDQKTWWKKGTVMTILNFLLNIGVCLPYWKIIGLW